MENRDLYGDNFMTQRGTEKLELELYWHETAVKYKNLNNIKRERKKVKMLKQKNKVQNKSIVFRRYFLFGVYLDNFRILISQ